MFLFDKCCLRGTNVLQVFFCKYNDPLYVKMEKLEIMIKLANERNIDQASLSCSAWGASCLSFRVQQKKHLVQLCLLLASLC